MKKMKNMWFILLSMIKAKEWLFIAKKDADGWYWNINMSDETAKEAECLYEEIKYSD